jgi:hypothetical protein
MVAWGEVMVKGRPGPGALGAPATASAAAVAEAPAAAAAGRREVRRELAAAQRRLLSNLGPRSFTSRVKNI